MQGVCGEIVTNRDGIETRVSPLAVEIAVASILPFGYAKETRVNAITFLIFSTSRGNQRA
jgi:hypothetical protein